MSTTFTVAVVLSPRPWSVRLHAFVADHVPDIEHRRRPRPASGVRRRAPHVLMIDDSSPWLTQSFVD